MATVDVSTWAELVSAISNVPSTEDTIIKITADIDLNDTNPEGVTNSFNAGWFGRTLVIDGSYTDSTTGESKRHVIKNLRTPITGTGSIFYFYYGSDASTAIGVKFKGIDFQNFILSSGHGFDYDDTHLRTFGLTLENCRFVGSRGNYYLIGRNHFTSSQYNCSNILNNCYVDMPWSGAGQTNLAYTSLIPKDDGNNTNSIANYCRFKETYGNWTYSDNYGMSPSIRVFSFSYFKCNGCRMEGSMTIPVWQNTTLTQHNSLSFLCAFFTLAFTRYNPYTPATQNVFDVSLICDDTGLTDFNKVVSCSGFSYLVKMDAKCKSDGSACTYTTNGADNIDGGANYPLPTLATPAQMKDPAYLSSQGFDIVVPSE